MSTVLSYNHDTVVQKCGNRRYFQRGKYERSAKDLSEFVMEDCPRKLDQIDSVTDLQELRVPPGNQLEALSGTRKGQHSIRVNDQYRICFLWTDSGPDQVEIVDYH